MSPGGPGNDRSGDGEPDGRQAQNLFGPVPGLTGLAETWYVARPVPGTLVAVPGAIFILAAAVRLILVTG